MLKPILPSSFYGQDLEKSTHDGEQANKTWIKMTGAGNMIWIRL